MVLSTLSSIAALGSAIYGGIKSAAANNKAQALIQQQRNDNKAWYEIQKSSDYTQRADVQAAIKRQRELLDEQYKRAKATQVVAGGTDESAALQKQAANKALSETMTDVAAQATAHKDNVEQQYRAQDAALNQQQAQSLQQQAAQTAQAASQAVNAGVNMVGQEIAAQRPAVDRTPIQQTTIDTSVNTDLTAAGNAQNGIVGNKLPKPKNLAL